jgi:hypothetical protein
LGQQALDSLDLNTAQRAINQAFLAQQDGPMNSLVATALVFTHLNAFRISRDVTFRDEALKYAPLLAEYPVGNLSLGQFYECIKDHEKAARYFQQCTFPDFPAAVFCRDKDYDRLDDMRSKWTSTANGQLHTILIDIGRKPRDEILARYEQFVTDESQSIGTRIAGLQVPLRLRDIDRAQAEATAIRILLDGQDLVEGTIPHLLLPLELLEAGEDHQVVVEREIRSGSSLRTMLAHYWDGHVKLGKGESDAAKRAFRDCANNVNFYSYVFWADALATRLDENPHWPSPSRLE